MMSLWKDDCQQKGRRRQPEVRSVRSDSRVGTAEQLTARTEGNAMTGRVVSDLALVCELLLNILSGLTPDGDVVETSRSFQRKSGSDGFSTGADSRDSYPIISIIVVSAQQEGARKTPEVGQRRGFVTSTSGEISLPA